MSDHQSFRPRKFPAPEFPPRQPDLIGGLAPAVFSPILGLIALAQGLALAAQETGMGMEMAELARGLVAGLWGLAFVVHLAKVWRRPAVLIEDLRPLPGRAGLGSATIGGMAVSVTLSSHWPAAALALVLVSLALHVALIGVMLQNMYVRGESAQVPDPTWHLSFGGLLMAVPTLRLAGFDAMASGMLWLGLVASMTIWLMSLAQFLRARPPAVLRPLLAIHLAPAALLALTGAMIGATGLSRGFLVLAVLLFLAMVVRMRWLAASGFTPVWGSVTFPLAVLAQALMVHGAAVTGAAVLVIGIVVNIGIAWATLRMVPGGRLSLRTNAAQA